MSATLLLETDGNLWSWGLNHWGQVGDSTYTVRDVPLKILDSVVAVTHGGGSAIRADGSLWAWGQMRSPVVPYMRHVPIPPVHVLDNVYRFYPTPSRDFVVRTDGSLWAWRRPGASFFWGEMRLVPYENAAPVRILECVDTVFSTQTADIALRCDGSLWDVTGDEAVHIMDAVVSVYPADSPTSRLRETFVLQKDNSLWAIDPSMGQAPRHLLDDVATVSRTSERAFIIQEGGRLWAMGYNEFGALGDGTTIYRINPVWIMDDVAYIFVSQGWSAITHAILNDGSLWGWGGQWDDGGLGFRLYPVHILDGVKSVYEMGISFAALKTDNSLWVWSLPGATGQAADFDVRIPVQILSDVESVYAAGTSIVALGLDGALWTWRSHSPRMDQVWETLEVLTSATDGMYWLEPVRVLESVVSVYTFGSSVYAVLDDSSLWALHVGLDGLLTMYGWLERPMTAVNISNAFSFAQGGQPPVLGLQADVRRVYGRRAPLMLSNFWAHSFVDADGDFWVWGDVFARYGGMSEDAETVVHLMSGVVYAHTDSGLVHAIRADGGLYAWRDGLHEPPVHVLGQVTAFMGQWHSNFALREDGSMWVWGRITDGLLGLDGSFVVPEGLLRADALAHFAPEPIQLMESVAAMYMGGDMVFARRYDGSLWRWGYGDLPAQIMDNVAVFHIHGDSYFAIQDDGGLWAWGRNDGRLGDGTLLYRDEPVKIMSDVVSVHTTGASTFAIRADGSLWAWGWNSQGQLGDGTAVSRLSPVHVMGGIRDVLRDIYLAPGASFAIDYDNGLWVWGGAFGAVPVRIVGEVDAVFTGYDGMTFYIRDIDGGLWALDRGGHVAEFFMYGAAGVYSAWDEMFALRENGELWAWGAGRGGYVGRGDAVRVVFALP